MKILKTTLSLTIFLNCNIIYSLISEFFWFITNLNPKVKIKLSLILSISAIMPLLLLSPK